METRNLNYPQTLTKKQHCWLKKAYTQKSLNLKYKKTLTMKNKISKSENQNIMICNKGKDSDNENKQDAKNCMLTCFIYGNIISPRCHYVENKGHVSKKGRRWVRGKVFVFFVAQLRIWPKFSVFFALCFKSNFASEKRKLKESLSTVYPF